LALSTYARPGQLVRANGTRLNLYCMGSGSPAVVFDSGWQDWAPVWAIVQPRLAQWTPMGSLVVLAPVFASAARQSNGLASS